MLTHEHDQFPGNRGLDLVADLQLIEVFEIGSGGERVSAVVGGNKSYLAGGGVDGGYSDPDPVTFNPRSPGHALTINTRSVLFVLWLGRARDKKQQRYGRDGRDQNLEWAELH